MDSLSQTGKLCYDWSEMSQELSSLKSKLAHAEASASHRAFDRI